MRGCGSDEGEKGGLEVFEVDLLLWMFILVAIRGECCCLRKPDTLKGTAWASSLCLLVAVVLCCR